MIPVVRVLAPNAGPFTLEGTNTWVVGRDPAVVIDPGPDDAGHLLAVIDGAEPVEAILLTHQHPDHAPGAARLAETTRAPVYAFRPQGEERRLRDGEVVEAGSLRVRAVHTPGHSPDHVAFLAEEEGLLFTGDAVLGRGTSIVDPPEGDMAAYMRSLRAMIELRPRTIYPGHGPVVFDAGGKLEYYLAHRVQREEQVLAALGAGRVTPEEMVPEIYGDEVSSSMFPAASRSVLAHLLKLEREDRVARTVRGGVPRFALVEPKACERCGRPARPGSRFCRRCALAVLQEGPTVEGPGRTPESRPE
jgi:glyoxylase-like metal-dependent hydrolase (beta-lactamase superfamily II)